MLGLIQAIHPTGAPTVAISFLSTLLALLIAVAVAVVNLRLHGGRHE